MKHAAVGHAESYHHGDLANACVAAALDLLGEHGLAGVTLREVARAINVSRSAPYRHFKDKRDLLAACACRGVETLVARANAVLAQQPSASAATVRRVLHEYARFGSTEPHLYRLMFASDFESDEYPALTAAAERAFNLLRGLVQRAQQSGALAVRDVDGLVLALWSSVHGLVSLHNELPGCSVLDTSVLTANLDHVLDIVLPAVALGAGQHG